jgi:hypothetical protein
MPFNRARRGPRCYFKDPTGSISEFTCDVIQIMDRVVAAKGVPESRYHNV